ncbi:MAG: hypothetical protein ACRETE_02370, partial [Stenotrophobium sp.]
AGYAAAPGFRADFRYDFINQNQLRTGTHAAVAADVANAVNTGTVGEYQQDTLTRFYTLGLDYSFNHDWGVNLQLPYLARYHSTIAEPGTGQQDSSAEKGPSDVRLTVRYQGIFDDRSLGVQLGVKLPTGDFHQKFSSGPDAGAQLDRGLQLGTGTTDLILGVYHFASLNRNWDHFEQAQVKAALDGREDFRPGAQLTASAGLRYVGSTRFIPQLQVNLKVEDRESGDPGQADIHNSGSRELALSPGLTYKPAKKVAIYGFVQLPVYRSYNGLQLSPSYIVSTGLRYSF